MLDILSCTIFLSLLLHTINNSCDVLPFDILYFHPVCSSYEQVKYIVDDPDCLRAIRHGMSLWISEILAISLRMA